MDIEKEILKLIRESGEMKVIVYVIKTQVGLILAVGGVLLTGVFTNLILNIKTHRNKKQGE